MVAATLKLVVMPPTPNSSTQNDGYSSQESSVVDKNLTEWVLTTEKFPFSTTALFYDTWRGTLTIPENPTTVVAIKAMRAYLPAEHCAYARFFSLVKCLASHPNVLPILGYVTNFQASEAFGLVNSFHEDDNAVQYVIKHTNTFERFSIVKGVAIGLQFLHSSGVEHGNFRGESIVVSSKNVPRISDYGIHTISVPTKLAHSNFRPLDLKAFYPPFAISGSGYEKKKDVMKIDVWAFGSTVVQLMKAVPSISELNQVLKLNGVKEKMWQPQFPAGFQLSYAAELENLCTSCWEKDTLSMNEIVKTISGIH